MSFHTIFSVNSKLFQFSILSTFSKLGISRKIKENIDESPTEKEERPFVY